MINHTHLVVVPKDPSDLARAIGDAPRRYTRMKNVAEGVPGHLIQGRFGSCVLNEKQLFAAAWYVELNPIQADLAGKAEAFPWSSVR